MGTKRSENHSWWGTWVNGKYPELPAATVCSASVSCSIVPAIPQHGHTSSSRPPSLCPAAEGLRGKTLAFFKHGFTFLFFSPKVRTACWMEVLRLTNKIFLSYCKQKSLPLPYTTRSYKINCRLVNISLTGYPVKYWCVQG